MSQSIQPATEDVLLEMAEVMVAALVDDPCWQGMKGSWTHEEEYDFTLWTLRTTMVEGFQLGSYHCWKVVDEDGKILAWAGLGSPISLTEEEKKPEGVANTYKIPLGRIKKILEFFRDNIFPSFGKHGYDSTKHFQRQNIMVRPEYQCQGLGRLLTEKCNEVADAGGAATYARAQPGSANLFIQMGYEVLEKIDINMSDFGVEGGKTARFIMKREPNAKKQWGKKLD